MGDDVKMLFHSGMRLIKSAGTSAKVNKYLTDDAELQKFSDHVFSTVDLDRTGFVEVPELKGCLEELCAMLGLDKASRPPEARPISLSLFLSLPPHSAHTPLEGHPSCRARAARSRPSGAARRTAHNDGSRRDAEHGSRRASFVQSTIPTRDLALPRGARAARLRRRACCLSWRCDVLRRDPQPSDDDVQTSLSDLDTNKDGKISNDEFKVLVQQARRPMMIAHGLVLLRLRLFRSVPPVPLVVWRRIDRRSSSPSARAISAAARHSSISKCRAIRCATTR